jgi:hypothetical protein
MVVRAAVHAPEHDRARSCRAAACSRCRPRIRGFVAAGATLASWIGVACANSQNASGGRITVDGGASLSDDDLILYPWRMTGNTSVDFQGSGTIASLLGDGKLCTSATFNVTHAVEIAWAP